jgi:transposase
MAQIEVKVKLDLPPGVEVLGYERCGDGHGFEVKFPLPLYCRCEKCGAKEPASYEGKNTVYAVRDLDLWGQPSFLIFQPYFHRCSRCGHRQEHFAPFKRKKVMYTYRFEEYVLRMLIGSNEEEVAQRLGISAETVALIVENQLQDDKTIAPERMIKHVGMDELSLKKRHKLYVTLMTDLTDPESPKVLGVARGRDTAAAQKCLSLLTPEQRAAVETHRVDMGLYGPVCAALLPNSRLVVDRFHVAKQFNDVVDDLRKKNTWNYKAGLSKSQQERFRSLMWEFRRDPKDLKPEEREALDRLFAELPVLKDVYDVRVRFKEIFDTAPDVATAEQQLAELRVWTESLGLDFGKFRTTYDNWKEGILNYFDGRYTSAAVEGINNKARVITNRCYGVKSSGTLWNRLILELNRASEAVGRTIGELREITSGLKAVFLGFCT